MIDGLIRIDTDTLACRDCGISVPRPDTTWIAEQQPEPRPGLPADRQPALNLAALCAECDSAAEHAKQLAAQLELDPLEVLNAVHAASLTPNPRWDTHDTALWGSAVWHIHRALAHAGYPGPALPLRFAAWEGFGAGIAAESRWSWLPDTAAGYIRRGIGAAEAETDILAESPPTTRVPHPRDGCAVCGVDGWDLPTVDVHRAGRRAAAAEVFKFNRGMILCPTCRQIPGDRATLVQTAAIFTAGIADEVAVARAAANTAGRPAPRLPPITGWSRAGAPASSEPFGWMDLDGWAIEVLAALHPAPEPTPTLEELAERVARLERAAGIR